MIHDKMISSQDFHTYWNKVTLANLQCSSREGLGWPWSSDNQTKIQGGVSDCQLGLWGVGWIDGCSWGALRKVGRRIEGQVVQNIQYTRMSPPRRLHTATHTHSDQGTVWSVRTRPNILSLMSLGGGSWPFTPKITGIRNPCPHAGRWSV